MGARTRALFGKKVHVQVHIAAEANHNFPVALDIVLVYDKKLLNELLQLPARAWFAKREQLKKDYPDGEAFESWEWEWVPGQRVNLPEPLPLRAKAKSGIVFANYLSPGEHRVRIDPHTSISIALLEEDFIVRPLE
jgi:type VI secretion system protein